MKPSGSGRFSKKTRLLSRRFLSHVFNYSFVSGMITRASNAGVYGVRGGGEEFWEHTLQMLDPLDYRVGRQFDTMSRMSCIYHRRFFGEIQALLISGGEHLQISSGRLEFCLREPSH